MNYEERKLAQQVMKERLGFIPVFDDIIPYESYFQGETCTYVSFRIKGHEEMLYRANSMKDLIIEYYGREIVRLGA